MKLDNEVLLLCIDCDEWRAFPADSAGLVSHPVTVNSAIRLQLSLATSPEILLLV
jgi:hypothetical protein